MLIYTQNLKTLSERIYIYIYKDVQPQEWKERTGLRRNMRRSHKTQNHKTLFDRITKMQRICLQNYINMAQRVFAQKSSSVSGHVAVDGSSSNSSSISGKAGVCTEMGMKAMASTMSYRLKLHAVNNIWSHCSLLGSPRVCLSVQNVSWSISSHKTHRTMNLIRNIRLRRKMNYKAQNHKTHEKHLCTCARPHTHFRATREDTQLQRYTAIYHRGYPHSCTTIYKHRILPRPSIAATYRTSHRRDSWQTTTSQCRFSKL